MHYYDSTWLNYEHKIERQLSIVSSILTTAKEYIDYTQIYVSYDSTVQELHLFLDAYSPINISHKTNSFAKQGVNGIKLDSTLNPIYLYQNYTININAFNPKDLIFVNAITKDTISKQNIYFNNINKSKPLPHLSTEAMLNRNKVKYKIIEDSLIIYSGTYTVNSDVIINQQYTTSIQAGVTFKMSSQINFCINGNLTINGEKTKPVIVKNLTSDKPYGTFYIIGSDSESYANINFLKVSGGNASYFMGRIATSQFAIYNTNVTLTNSSFKNSYGDDGINIKYSKVNITDCNFSDNYADQIDLDFCLTKISNSTFTSANMDSNGDGLDLSGSYASISNCHFSDFLDKGLSLGEKSKVILLKTSFENNETAIAVKDETKLFAANNTFTQNHFNLISFIKKPIFNAPTVYLTEQIDHVNLITGKVNQIKISDLEIEQKRFNQAFKYFSTDQNLSNKIELNNLIESH